MTALTEEGVVPTFRLRDIDNRDDAMRPYEFVGDVEMVVGYLDGPLRRDLTSELEDGASLDEAIAAVRDGNLELANAVLRTMSVTLYSHPTTLREERALRKDTDRS